MKRKIVLLTLIISLLITSFASINVNAALTFQNPVSADVTEDPYCFRDGDWYYVYYQENVNHTGGRVMCYRSKDLLNWELVGEVYNNVNDSYNGHNTKGLWAPEVHKINGKYYLYYVNVMDNELDDRIGDKDVCVVEGTSPTSFTGNRVVLLDNDYAYIDPSFFVDSDGLLYLLYKYRGAYGTGSSLYIAKMSTPTSLPTNKVQVLHSSQVTDSQNILEHPYLDKKNGNYVLFFSYGQGSVADYTQGYKVGYAKAVSVQGPYTLSSANPIMYTDQTPGVLAPGAVSIVKDATGSRWMVYRQKLNRTDGWARVLCINRCTIGDAGNVTITATRTNYADAPVTWKYSDDFNDGNANGWTVNGGTWSVSNGQYAQTSAAAGKSYATYTNFRDFTYEADVTVDGNENAGLIFRVDSVTGPEGDDYKGYYAGLNANGNFVRLGKANNNWTIIATTNMTVNVGTTYHMKVVCSGSNIKVYVNDMVTPKINATDSTWTQGWVGFRSYNTPARFDNMNVIEN